MVLVVFVVLETVSMVHLPPSMGNSAEIPIFASVFIIFDNLFAQDIYFEVSMELKAQRVNKIELASL